MKKIEILFAKSLAKLTIINQQWHLDYDFFLSILPSYCLEILDVLLG